MRGRSGPIRTLFIVLATGLVASLVSVGATARATTAPRSATTSATGPRLTVSHSALTRSLTCHGSLAHPKGRPILLVPGTTLDPSINFSWNYERAFTARHLTWCAVTLPGEAMADAQVSAEYVVHAIRHMHDGSHGKVDILGYSQGGMLPRWALKYWPDTRRDVDDFVAIDPSNHGTLDADGLCGTLHRCAPSIWQQQSDSHFLTALNHGPETFAGISFTVVYSHDDEVVVPNTSASGSSSLHGGKGKISDIAVQSICPLDSSDHLAMGTYDPVAYAVAMDAFHHSGPARASRIASSTCMQAFQPGVDPATFAQHYAAYVAHIAEVLATSPMTSSEPALATYAR